MLVPQSLLRLQGMFDIYFKSFIHVDRVLLRWEAEAHTSISFSVPDNWKAGQIWVRDELVRLLLLHNE